MISVRYLGVVSETSERNALQFDVDMILGVSLVLRLKGVLDDQSRGPELVVARADSRAALTNQ